ncbi:Peptidase family M23 [Arthrobacter subterraneus]|uniref:Peptidase family M23 n=1 Tax=Arthrobacter subterraneus TaxID=335973 RepID=A0A1G8DM17_9MICC|nr:M23 family metallopeptidase [Arthrobacter subterraneus]SDH58641.1 Peptidase family M23 [Arthrobacter subterraneus]
MSDVKPVSGRRRAVKNRPRAVRSGMSVCLALAVIYSFGHPGSTPLTSGVGVTGAVTSGLDSSSGTILAQGSGLTMEAGLPHTGYVGAQVLGQPSQTFPFGTTDSLVPGRELPGQAASGRSTEGSGTSIAGMNGGAERPDKGMLISPLQFLSPSSPFGVRTSPITGQNNEFHSGQDFAAPCGTRVFSADAGIVRAVGWHPWGGGNRVEVDHGNGLVTTYNHLEGIAVKTGDRVGAGQVIATIGTSGLSTGCHLHFETILDGEHTDPAAWKLIPVENSGPADMPALVNYTPGTNGSKDGNTAWVAYLASAEAIHPVAVNSPPRVDADMAAQGPRSSTRTTTAGGNQSTGPGKPSSSISVAATPSPSPSGTKSTTTSPKPKTPAPGTSSPTPTTSTTPPPPKASGDTESAPSTPTPPALTATDPAPAPPVADPTPTPPVTDTTPTPPVNEPTPPVTDTTPAPPPVVTAPEPAPVVVVPDPTPAPGVTDPTPAVPAPVPTISVTNPLEACDPAVDPEAIVVDPVTGEPVLDPVTGKPIKASELCASASATASASASTAAGATGTEPAREVDPALVPAP